MGNLHFYLWIYFIMFFCLGCSNQARVHDKEADALVLSEKILPKELFSDYLSLESIIPIETNDSCMISSIRRIILYKEKAFILNGYQEVLVIDNKTGKFLGRIRKLGNGPGEYSQIMDIAICEDTDNIILYSDRMKLLFYDLGLNYIADQDVSGELYESITCSKNLLYFYNPLGTSGKHMIDIYNIKTKEWDGQIGNMTCDFNFRFEGIPLVKSRSIWYASPLQSKLFCIDDKSIKKEYNLLMSKFGSKDKLLEMREDPAAFFEYINKEEINYVLTSIKETLSYVYCKSNIYPFIFLNKESGKVNYVEHLFDPIFGYSPLKYISHDNDGDMIMFTLAAEDWICNVDCNNIPIEISNRMPKQEINEESNCILLFYEEKKTF